MKVFFSIGFTLLILYTGSAQSTKITNKKALALRSYLKEEGLKGNIKSVKRILTTKQIEITDDIYINVKGNIDSVSNKVCVLNPNTIISSTGYKVKYYYDTEGVLKGKTQSFRNFSIEISIEDYQSNNEGYAFYTIKDKKEKILKEVTLNKDKRINTQEITFYEKDKTLKYKETFTYTKDGWIKREDEKAFFQGGQERERTKVINYEVKSKDKKGNPLLIIGTDEQRNIVEQIIMEYTYRK